MNNFFSFLGKFFVFVGVAGILIGGGYYLGTKFATTPKKAQSIAIAPTPTPTTSITSATPSITGSEGKTGRFAVEAGGIKPFSAYMLSGVGGWTLSKTETSAQSKVVLSKGDYSVAILQGAFGGGPCVFPGDQPQDMAMQLSTSTMIELLSGNPLRRGQSQAANAKETDFTVCQKTTSGYTTLTDFGAINYVTPFHPDSEILAEMDAMVGSLQKQ